MLAGEAALTTGARLALALWAPLKGRGWLLSSILPYFTKKTRSTRKRRDGNGAHVTVKKDGDLPHHDAAPTGTGMHRSRQAMEPQHTA